MYIAKTSTGAVRYFDSAAEAHRWAKSQRGWYTIMRTLPYRDGVPGSFSAWHLAGGWSVSDMARCSLEFFEALYDQWRDGGACPRNIWKGEKQ